MMWLGVKMSAAAVNSTDLRSGGQQYRSAQQPAEKKHHRWDYRQRKSSENAAFPKTDRPNYTIYGGEHGIDGEIYCRHFA